MSGRYNLVRTVWPFFNIGARAGLRGQSHIVKYQWSSKKNLFVKSRRLSVFSAKSNFEVKSDFLD